jgi:peptidyl-prolyl cis-trans isomerase C
MGSAAARLSRKLAAHQCEVDMLHSHCAPSLSATWLALLLAVGAAIPGDHPRAQDAGPVAARVNGAEIRTARLQRALDAYLKQNNIGAGRDLNPEHQTQVKRQVLDVLIGRELLWQEAQATGAVASDEETEATLVRLQQRFDSEASFLAKLREGGYDRDSYAAQMKRRLSVHKLVNDHLSKSIDVTAQEVDDFYQANIDRFRSPEEVHARHILIKLDADASEAQAAAALEQLESIGKELAAGADFADLARSHSQGPSASKGGDLGFFGPGRMVPAFEEAAFALAPGQVSAPVRSRFGYHLIKLEARRGGAATPLAQVEDRISQHLYGLEQQRVVKDRVLVLREAADIEVLIGLTEPDKKE